MHASNVDGDKALVHNLQDMSDMVKQYTTCGIMQQSRRSCNKMPLAPPERGAETTGD